MGKKEDKTNAMRLLDSRRIAYEIRTYDDVLDVATEVAVAVGEPTERVFKTLVTVGKSGEHYVFMLPSDRELDLKKAARAAGEKSVSMIPQKELLPLTGYIHGGCSPLGMKKLFKTFIHQTAVDYDCICFSGGRRGLQIKLPLTDLQQAIPVTPADLVMQG